MDTEKHAKIADIEALRVVLFWQRSKVPGLEPVLSKLDGLDCLELGLVDEVLYRSV